MIDVTAYDYRFALACKTAIDNRRRVICDESGTLSREDACRAACKEVGLPETMYYPMASWLEAGYEEDFMWIEDILAGKTEEILNPQIVQEESEYNDLKD